MTLPAVPSTGPFYLHVADGPRAEERFCFFHAAGAGDASTPARGCVLAVHAFAEEMNKRRAASATAARALASAGFHVLQIDLGGCGDSAGEFEDATWAGWLADLTEAWSWLALRCPGPRWIWGTRLGALLADQLAATCHPSADGLLLWQPVVNGAQHLGQFLRLKTVNAMLRDPSPAVAMATVARRDAGPTPSSPRADLAAGLSIEVAGYRLTPGLADAIESARLGSRTPDDGRVVPRVRWLEVSSQGSSQAASPPAALTPVASKVADRWRASGSDVAVVHVAGSPFWQTLEIERCDALVEATVEALS